MKIFADLSPDMSSFGFCWTAFKVLPYITQILCRMTGMKFLKEISKGTV